MTRWRTTLAAVVMAGGLLATTSACGGDDDAGPPDTADLAADATTAELVISGFAFSGPATVPVGTTVIVRNDDSAQHTWSSTDGVFESGVLAAGETFSFTFDQPGEFAYFCQFHPSMAGTITVTD